LTAFTSRSQFGTGSRRRWVLDRPALPGGSKTSATLANRQGHQDPRWYAAASKNF
jgi:hypothetical protein